MESGIGSYCITNLNDASSCNFKETNLTQITETIEESGTYYAFAKDKAGNISISSEFEISDRYNSGDALELGGYKWHVIGDDGSNVTLLMDAGQIKDMSHCGSNNDSSNNCTYNGSYYVYSWDKSLINNYLKNTLYPELKDKITNEIVPVEVCIDPSKYNSQSTYGGYLKTEIEKISGARCNNGYETDYVRLITLSEHWNLNPSFTGQDEKYPNVLGITRISKDSDYMDWLYCITNNCGESYGRWWTMTSYTNKGIANVRFAYYLQDASLNLTYWEGETQFGVRPVITIKK